MGQGFFEREAKLQFMFPFIILGVGLVFALIGVVIYNHVSKNQELPLEDSFLDGAWKSNRELTLLGLDFDELHDVSEEGKELLKSENFFGRMVQVFQNGVSVVVFEGECIFGNFVVLTEEDGYLDVLFADNDFVNGEEKRLYIVDGRIELPFMDGKGREVFSRITVAEAVAEHECLLAGITLPE